MKKLLKSAAGIALGVGLFCSIQPVKAQIYNEFKPSYRVNSSYISLDPTSSTVEEKKGSQFLWIENGNISINRNDGFAKVNLNLTGGFKFGGKVYQALWISPNGFVTFEDPANVSSLSKAYCQSATSLFKAGINMKAIIAPFWGNHAFRDPAENTGVYPAGDVIPTSDGTPFVQSHVYVQNGTDMLVIEWRDLNINIVEPDVTAYPSSIASFQLRLYKSNDVNVTSQGDIEFCYGSIGQTGGTSRQEGMSVGIKGNMKGAYDDEADYINGLDYDMTSNNTAKADERLTVTWPPTLHTDKRIHFEAIEKWIGDSDTWGDGDADISKALYIKNVDATTGKVTFVPGKHLGKDQKRFVTANDIRVVMRSVVTNVPLDSCLFQAAYHADVNHNGRFFYMPASSASDAKLVRTDFPLQTENYTTFFNSTVDYSNYFANINSDVNRIYFQANEADAAKILAFLAGKEVTLPVWNNDLLGKAGAVETASDINFGAATDMGNGVYQVPVYLNNNANDAVSFKFNINGTILNVASENATADFENNRVAVIAASGNSAAPICTIQFSTNSNNLTASDVVYNEQAQADKSMKLSDNATTNEAMSVYPNPMTGNATLQVNVPTLGIYEINVYDILGNKVANVYNGSANQGLNSFPMNMNLGQGVYFVRMIGEGQTLSTRISVSK